MAVTLKLKTGTTVPTTSNLVAGEPGFDNTTGNLYVRNASDEIVTIGGAGALAAKQASLVSGTNIKTINGVSVLGSGDIVVSGGGGSSWLLNIAEFFDTTYRYFLGDTASAGWKVNRYVIATGVRTVSDGTGARPTTLAGVQALTYS